jgi:hypothetical protein
VMRITIYLLPWCASIEWAPWKCKTFHQGFCLSNDISVMGLLPKCNFIIVFQISIVDFKVSSCILLWLLLWRTSVHVLYGYQIWWILFRWLCWAHGISRVRWWTSTLP